MLPQIHELYTVRSVSNVFTQVTNAIKSLVNSDKPLESLKLSGLKYNIRSALLSTANIFGTTEVDLNSSPSMAICHSPTICSLF